MPPPPSRIDLHDLEIATSAASQNINNLADRPLAGARVAGSGIVNGTAYVASIQVAENGAVLESFEDGDILVCPMVHPNWLPYVMRSGGVICDVGGWLSHIAIVAREHNIAMIVGVKSYASIKDGDLLALDNDGTISRAEKPGKAMTASAAE